MFNHKKSKEVVVKNYPYEQSAKSILSLLKNGGYYYSNGLADEQPFSSYIAVSRQEYEEYDNEDKTPNQKARERYAYKKRRIFLDQFIALKTLGFARQTSQTSSASYGLTPYGKQMVQGLAIVEEAEKLGLTYEEVLRRLRA